jgi:hypothetical protein
LNLIMAAPANLSDVAGTMNGVRSYSVQVTADGNLYSPDFPNASKFVEVPVALGKRFAHLGLHQTDLLFAIECLDELDRTLQPGEPTIAQRGLWHAALIATYKCFQASAARFKLVREDICEEGPVRVSFDYFKHLRNKHVAHDQNDMAQAHVMAVLERPGTEPKVSEALCLNVLGSTVSQQNSASLRGVVQAALAWVEERLDVAAEEIVNKMNGWSYEELDSMPPIQGKQPTLESIAVTRSAPGP